MLMVLGLVLLLRQGLPGQGPAGTPGKTGERFDNQVRDDFFSGMAGDREAFDRAMKLCEERLKQDPNDAEALVWHGAGLDVLSGRAFREGDPAKGADLRRRGQQEMEQAVAADHSIVTLIPRGSVMLQASRNIPSPERAQAALRQGLADYEEALRLDEHFAQRPVHARGELLAGLADGWYRAGDQAKADLYLKRIVAELEPSPYATRAKFVLANHPAAGQLQLTCLGCHYRKLAK
ncbi:MAG TPA: hypothetical protein VEG08_15120 [Terriglobales bacterium]|nr:hypothetical protein [Terriglobales bacterium]